MKKDRFELDILEDRSDKLSVYCLRDERALVLTYFREGEYSSSARRVYSIKPTTDKMVLMAIKQKKEARAWMVKNYPDLL